jgi:tetratricopeptide (TPR) repeat protein
MRYRRLAPFVALFLLTQLQAQIRGGMGGASTNRGNIHVHIVVGNDRSAGPNLVVKLLPSDSDAVIGTSFTDDRGEVEFLGVPAGNYHVQVSGDGIETTSSDSFEVDQRRGGAQSQYVTVRRLEESGPKPVSAKSTMVSAADLKVPQQARKELDKANESMAQKNWKKAKEHLDKALALDATYVTAYNNLAVLYAKTDDLPKEEEALKKAISLDEHYAPPLLNYGKLSIRQKNFPQAEALLQKEVALDPNNPESLLLLAHAEYMNRHFEAAISSAAQAHTSSPEHASFVHYIAARAYQQTNQQQQALMQFEAFLKEEPKGPRADHVRGEMAKIPSAAPQTTAAQ